MYNANLYVYDVSSMLYAGTRAPMKTDFIGGSSSVEGLPVGGIRYILYHAIENLMCGDAVVFCMDSPTDKSKYYADYKSARVADPAIHIQQQMFLDMARGCGFDYLKADNFEADDLVHYVVKTHWDNFKTVKILSGDRDLAANIFNEHITLIGSASIYPTICSQTYECTVKKGASIPYNMILPYYMFFGKPSNSVAPFSSKAENNRLWESFKEYSEKSHTVPGNYSTKEHFAAWLVHCIENDEESLELVEKLLDRTEYVYPREYTSDVKFGHKKLEDLNGKALGMFLKTFNLDTILDKLRMYDAAPNGLTPEMRDYIRNYKQVFTDGTLAVDNDLSADASFFEAESTDIFADVGDF